MNLEVSRNELWPVDVSYLNLFYFLISVLNGHSRFIVHWEITPTMKEMDIELLLLGYANPKSQCIPFPLEARQETKPCGSIQSIPINIQWLMCSSRNIIDAFSAILGTCSACNGIIPNTTIVQ